MSGNLDDVLDDVLDGDSERVETPADPFDKVVLNPGASVEASTNPLCPDCEEPIRPWANQYQRRFTCGCEQVKRFPFTRSTADTEQADGGENA